MHAAVRPCIVVTRPVGSGRSLLRQARARGATAVALPGLSLRPAADADAARAALRDALGAAVVVFTSPAAVRFAKALAPLRPAGAAVALGAATAGALRRAGVAQPWAPARADSEGVLALAPLEHVAGRSVALVGARGGRQVLAQALAARGATTLQAHVYQRLPARLDQRHLQALRSLPAAPYVLWSSATSLANLRHALPGWAWSRLTAGTAVVSSERIDVLAAEAGFARRLRAGSALAADLLDCVPGLAGSRDAAATRT